MDIVVIARELGMRPLEARCELATGRALITARGLDERYHLMTVATVFGLIGMRS